MSKFAEAYARSWCSQDPDSVASFFTENGSLKVNDGELAIGRKAIAEVAGSFMTAFPDLVVALDDYIEKPNGDVEFHWTLTGTNSGPGGSGRKVSISGHEEWTFSRDGLIETSLGHFDAAEYERQISTGV